jgi:predicted membrane protein DUF2157
MTLGDQPLRGDPDPTPLSDGSNEVAIGLGGGIISFVAANWQGIPAVLKAGMLLAVMLATGRASGVVRRD